MAFDIDIGADAQPDAGFDIVIGTAAVLSADPPGSTLEQLQAGGSQWRWVAAIYGYDKLLSSAPSEPTLDAWSAAGDWSECLGGSLFVDLENSQSLNPWQPFTQGGTLTLRVAPDAADTFGVDVHRTTQGAETMLDDTTGAGDTPITVLSTSAFDSGGIAYIGSEAFTYSGTTATTFTGCTRGVFSPFATDPSGSGFAPGQFGNRHEVVNDPNAIRLQPLVTAQPRLVASMGRWLGLYLHRWDEENQLLNTKANAQLVFAGRVVAIGDDPGTNTTTVEVEHILDAIKRATIGPDWTARIKEGMYVDSGSGWEFNMSDSSDANATFQSADPLVVVSSGASGAYEMNEGFYTHQELCDVINTWLAQAKTDGDLDGTYHIGLGPYGSSTGPTRTYFSYKISGTGPTVSFKLTYPRPVSDFFGDLEIPTTTSFAELRQQPDSLDGVDYDRVSARTPPRNGFIPDDVNIQSIFEVEDERGEFVDQTGDLPSEVTPSGGASLGLIMINNQAIFGVQKIGSRLSAAVPITSIRLAGQQRGVGFYEFIKATGATVDDPEGAPTVKQILFYQDSFANILKKLFFTVNGEGYNHADWDTLPRQLGLGIPGELLGQAFIDSCDSMPGADGTFTLVVDKVTKIEDLLSGSLVFRWTFLRWIDQHLEFCNWRTPTTGDVLSESNKAAPIGTDDISQAATITSNDWQRQTIKVEYDRDINALDFSGGFRSDVTLIDRVAKQDAAGDDRTITLQLRGTYGIDGVDELKSQFKATAPIVATRPVSRSNRTIDSRFFEGFSVGDCVLVTDAFARDPDTGQRGVATRPGIIVRHSWSLGGEGPNGSISDVGGEVDVMFLPLLRVAQYVPTAVLDETSTNAGYVIATKIATCRAHEYSEASEAADASYFTAGRKIRFIEIDPVNPAAPSTHDDTVASQSGNTITLTTGFAAFSNTKRYKIVFDTYGDSTAEQQAQFVYQADDADGQIEDTRAPFQYTSPPLIRGSANAADDEIELPADNTFGDGVGRDVGTDVSCNRLVNNMLDFKCTLSQPYIDDEMSGDDAGPGEYLLCECTPIWLTAETNNAQHTRKLKVAPYFKSTSGLTTVSVRVTVTRSLPTSSSLIDVNRGTILAEAEFSTNSTTYAIPTAVDLTLTGIKSQSGRAYILVELTDSARCRGLAVCQESERFTFE